MFFREYAPYLELGGLLLALLDFLGFDKILRRFVEWQGEQFRHLLIWLDDSTEISLLKLQMNNINYFFLLFTLISLYFSFVKASVMQYKMGVWSWIFLVVGYIGLYFFIWKILIPVIKGAIAIYYWLLSILVNKGALTIIGLLLAVTSFVVNSTIAPAPAPVTEQVQVEPSKADVGTVTQTKTKSGSNEK